MLIYLNDNQAYRWKRKVADMMNYCSALLEDLATVDWVTAANTYGNNHSTLIGLIVQWWVKKNPTNRQVLEGAPSVRYENPLKQESVRGHGDAMLCEDNVLLGIIEVEGTRYQEAAAKIGGYFSKYPSLQFGILLLYVTGARGKGAERRYQSANNAEALTEVKKVTESKRDKPIIVITFDKELLPKSEWFFCNSFYGGRPKTITGYLYLNKDEPKQLTYFNR